MQEAVPGAVQLGTAQKAPDMAEIMTAMDSPDSRIVVHLAGRPLAHRAAFVGELLQRLQERQTQQGRPHRIFINDSDSLFTDDRSFNKPWSQPAGLVYSADCPARIAESILRTVEVVLAVGTGSAARLEAYAERAGLRWSPWTGPDLRHDEGLIWTSGQGLQRFHIALRPQDSSPTSVND
jgi:hypothetical protein